MKLRIVVVGKPRRDVVDTFVADYLARLKPIWQTELVAVAEERIATGRTEGEILAKEAERLRDKVPAGWVTVALDRTGMALDSGEFADALRSWQDSSVRGVAFVIGGAVGLDPAFARGCALRLSLGPMTFPHVLALVVLAEQIYRAATIVKGLPYHR